MKRSMQGAFWVTVYLLLVTAALFALLIGPTPPGRGFWQELSLALGFAGLSIIGFQFLITARFPAARPLQNAWNGAHLPWDQAKGRSSGKSRLRPLPVSPWEGADAQQLRPAAGSRRSSALQVPGRVSGSRADTIDASSS